MHHRVAMKLLTLSFALLLFASLGCEKRDVPLGGECTADGDCQEESAVCLTSGEAETGFCTRSCVEGDPAVDCPEGMTCESHEDSHFTLGSNYCEKSGGGSGSE